MLGRVGNRFDSTRNSTAIILVIDSDKEKVCALARPNPWLAKLNNFVCGTLSKHQEIGLGRSWPFPALGERQAIISGPLLRNIGAAKSDYVTLTIDIADLATVPYTG